MAGRAVQRAEISVNIREARVFTARQFHLSRHPSHLCASKNTVKSKHARYDTNGGSAHHIPQYTLFRIMKYATSIESIKLLIKRFPPFSPFCMPAITRLQDTFAKNNTPLEHLHVHKSGSTRLAAHVNNLVAVAEAVEASSRALGVCAHFFKVEPVTDIE
jgi:hypothetical protein